MGPTRKRSNHIQALAVTQKTVAIRGPRQTRAGEHTVLRAISSRNQLGHAAGSEHLVFRGCENGDLRRLLRYGEHGRNRFGSVDSVGDTYAHTRSGGTGEHGRIDAGRQIGDTVRDRKPDLVRSVVVK